ncbi:MAG: hypothetical protein ACRDV3_00720 [Acidothermaceae bacterium]
MNDDTEYLREVFRPFDPGRSAAQVEGERLPEVVDFSDARLGAVRRRVQSRHLAVVASAAAVAVLATVGIWATKATHSHPGVAPGTAIAGSYETLPAPAGFDHIRWQDWSSGQLLDTANRWVSADGHGKLTRTNAAGRLTTDLTIVPATKSASAASKASASATPAPTNGTDTEPIEYPGIVPTDVASLRSYLAAGQNNDAHIAQRLVGLLFARALTVQQERELVSIARSISVEPVTTSSAPTGAQVQLIALPPLPMSSQWWLAISADGTSLVGICYDQSQQVWRIPLLSEHTASIK